jgi:hypothetical protein
LVVVAERCYGMTNRPLLWPSCPWEFNDDLDVVRSWFQCFAPSIEWYASRDQAAKPFPVSVRQRVRRHFIVAAIGVHSTEHDLVVEHQGAVEPTEIHVMQAVRARHAGQAHDAGGGGASQHVADDRRHPRAFDDDVGREVFKDVAMAVS